MSGYWIHHMINGLLIWQIFWEPVCQITFFCVNFSFKKYFYFSLITWRWITNSKRCKKTIFNSKILYTYITYVSYRGKFVCYSHWYIINITKKGFVFTWYKYSEIALFTTRWRRVSKLIMPKFSPPKVTLVSIFVDHYLVPVLF